MASIEETAGSKTPLGAALADGLNTISLNQEITFSLYVKIVLPLDGYVFWVNSAILSDSAIYNASQYNKFLYDQPPDRLPARSVKVQGSLHYSSQTNQLEDRTAVFSHVIFTSLSEIVDFQSINPQIMYVADWEGMKFAFNRRDAFYKQADLYHYRGDPLYSIMDTQLVDSIDQIDTDRVIVSNSLPIWLTLNQYFPMYPSFLVQQNLPPPYASVHIEPSSTQALQSFPRLNEYSSHFQLVKETVRITIYGTRNYNALEFQDYVFQYSLDTDNIGILNMPVVQDEKVTQSEFGIIAQKKVITFEISYYQENIRNLARRLIEHAFMEITLQPNP
jgi:hypothetical protein